MSALAILLILVSAVMHATWNMLGKRASPGVAFFLLAQLAGALVMLPVLLFAADLPGQFPPQVWWLLAFSGLAQAVYYGGLAVAYRSGDMSVAYPLARALPVVLVGGWALALGAGAVPGPWALGGILLVVCGVLLLPLRRFTELRLSHYRNRSCALAVVAALGTVGYSLSDDAALRMVRPLAAGEVVLATLVYALIESLAAAAWLGLLLALRGGRTEWRDVWRRQRGIASLTGVIIYATYGLVLVSMAYVDNVSYVVAFRQVSIPIGALLGILVLREAAHAPRLAGVAVVFVGLVAVALG